MQASRLVCRFVLLTLVTIVTTIPSRADAAVILSSDGTAHATIYVNPAVMSPNRDDTANLKSRDAEAELQRQRLRDSVLDLAKYLSQIGGGRFEVATTPPPATANANSVAILVGDLATAQFGPPKSPFTFKQGFRFVVDAKGSRLGLIGESDLATSYAVYEFLDRLGCRWFMPGEMGEVIPQLKTIALDEIDFSSHPGTVFRHIWYADDAYRRRNRLGGLLLNAGHALELTGSYLSEQEKQAHPEWIGTIGGKPVPNRFKWSSQPLADFIADKIIERHATNPQPSYSLSPEDGMNFDDSPEDKALDANDFDATFQMGAITDRMIVLDNRIINRVTAKYPDALFGVLAYAQYTRPPVREQPHPNLVPQIAPITYSRAHPMDDDRVPGNKDLRHIVEGWAKASKATSYYFYAWFLAEPIAPNPMLTKWGRDVPYVFNKGNCQFWQPETTANFETSMHALYLGNRLAWDPKLQPADVIREINERFYGNAAPEMTTYWNFIDQVWVDTDEYSGCGFGYLRRWTPQRLQQSRALMNAALAAAQTPAEKFRVKLADDSLSLFTDFMALRYDQAEGRFAGLDERADAWKTRLVALGEQYKDYYTFTRVSWDPRTMSGGYFVSFYEPAYRDAARIAREAEVLTNPPLRTWKFLADIGRTGEAAGYMNDAFDDTAWRTTDVAAETWSTLGYHDYFKSMWYRTEVTLTPAEGDKKTYLWLSSIDGIAKVFVNGKHVPYVAMQGPDAGTSKETASGYCQPLSFDISTVMHPGANQIAIFCTRTDFNELGTGGLIGPAIIYRTK